MQSHIIKCEPLICGELQEFERETAIVIKSDFNGNDSAEKNSNKDVGKEQGLKSLNPRPSLILVDCGK